MCFCVGICVRTSVDMVGVTFLISRHLFTDGPFNLMLMRQFMLQSTGVSDIRRILGRIVRIIRIMGSTCTLLLGAMVRTGMIFLYTTTSIDQIILFATVVFLDPLFDFFLVQ